MAIHLLLNDLFQKYTDNRCSPKEIDQLLDLLKDPANKVVAEELIEVQMKQKAVVRMSDADLNERLEQRLQYILNSEWSRDQVSRSVKSIYKWIAAASVIVLIITGGYLWLSGVMTNAGTTAATKTSTLKMNPTVAAGYTRSLVLPDGSSVVLKRGSTLQSAEGFNKNDREVILAGEAYFDIVHDAERPFVIRTGNIRTTVLGTTFNIKADQENITVSVTKGSVKVQNGPKILAVLTQDQQIVYSQQKDLSDKKKVNAVSVVTDWTKQDMNFEDKCFRDITAFLEKRFGVNVSYVNPLLEQCTITASFDGTESLEKILTVLCQVRPARFSIRGDRVTIDGEPCKQ